jgi:aspartate 4-decarboxylase
VRVSLANLADDTYSKIGRMLKEVAGKYVEEWKAAGGK